MLRRWHTLRQSHRHTLYLLEVVPFLLQALPAFRSLLLAKSPVALSLKNCANEPLILRSVQARVRINRQACLSSSQTCICKLEFQIAMLQILSKLGYSVCQACKPLFEMASVMPAKYHPVEQPY